mgnify:CR=1 FL=1
MGDSVTAKNSANDSIADKKAQKKQVFDGDLSKLDKKARRELFRNNIYPYSTKLGRKDYEAFKFELQIELLKLQNWVRDSGERLLILCEGRDAAGKARGGSVATMTGVLTILVATNVALNTVVPTWAYIPAILAASDEAAATGEEKAEEAVADAARDLERAGRRRERDSDREDLWVALSDFDAPTGEGTSAAALEEELSAFGEAEPDGASTPPQKLPDSPDQ